MPAVTWKRCAATLALVVRCPDNEFPKAGFVRLVKLFRFSEDSVRCSAFMLAISFVTAVGLKAKSAKWIFADSPSLTTSLSSKRRKGAKLANGIFQQVRARRFPQLDMF